MTKPTVSTAAFNYARARTSIFTIAGMMVAAVAVLSLTGAGPSASSGSLQLSAPAGTLPATMHVPIDGFDAAVIPTGRILTPAGTELSIGAPKPYGLALSPDGSTLITTNNGVGPFSVTLIRNLGSGAPLATLVKLDATFQGVVFSNDGTRFYASGGEDGLVWVGNTATNSIVALVNLNTVAHPLTGPVNPMTTPTGKFRGSFPGSLTLDPDGRFLYVVDQGAFVTYVIDTTKIDIAGHGLSAADPNNFAAVAGAVKVGRYPFGIAASSDNHLLVANVGIFQYKHLDPVNPTGNPNHDYPVGYPGTAYPGDMENDKTIKITKVDPRNLPPTLQDPLGIRVGYIPADTTYTIPGLGTPNAPESSSVYVLNINSATGIPSLNQVVKTGPQVGEVEDGIAAFGGSHPNALAVGPQGIYVSNGNNDSISILHPQTFKEQHRVSLSVVDGFDQRLKGVQPVALAVSPDGNFLYVAEAGINAIGVLRLSGKNAHILGHIPVGWWPSAVQVSPNGDTLYVANAHGRGAPPNDGVGSPKSSTIGTVNIIPVPSDAALQAYTARVLRNNGFVPGATPQSSSPIPTRPNTPSGQIKHVIFINKENATHDLLLGDIVVTRRGVPVNGQPAYSLGVAASPNHHELALEFAFSDNFYLEPSVSSDGHRWLTNNYTSEFEDTHWPASYGGRRGDAGDNPATYIPYPGRLGFTDANSSPAPEDYPQHGSNFLHLFRNGKSFVNFGNGYEFAEVDEDSGTEPTGIRNHVNVPMEQVLRDHSDHLFPEFNTAIPDAPLTEDSTRFSRFGRFKQVFEAQYADRVNNVCNLPSYVDLYYPNDHGGGPFDINPMGPAWSFTRFVQDNDAALGMTVDLISHSPCWKDTVIFVVEDDTQNGLDHVNGHRSIFLAVSPWVKRQYVGKLHYSLSSIFKTVDLILGIPPLNLYDLASTDLRDIFTNNPDYTPYTATPITFAKRENKTWNAMTRGLDFSRPDSDEVRLRAAILKSEGLPRAH
jgi:DNA-binding beta-propeller fold protein YncE